MMEAGVVINRCHNPVYWHQPMDSSSGSLPDDRDLWAVLWDLNKDQSPSGLLGFAHTHPGRGMCGPSSIDISTFEAIEAALGRHLHWWIINEDHFVVVRRGNISIDSSPAQRPWGVTEMEAYPSWVYELARRSGFQFLPKVERDALRAAVKPVTF